jgi:amino acid permease
MYMYATCLACTIVITQLFVMVSNAFGVPKDITGDVYDGISWYKSTQAILTSAFILGPLSLGRDMGSFKNLAILSLSCLILTILVVLIELPFYETLYQKNYSSDCLKVTNTCYSAQFFNGAGIILFAFTNQCNVLPVYQELVNPVKYRLMKIIRRSIILVFSLYVIMSLSGYFSTLNNTPEVILSRDPPTDQWSTDWL